MTTTTRTLADVKRQAAVEHVLTATVRLVLDHGLGVTMDQIAATTGVSRRTLFRLFDSRDRLILEAFKSAQDSYFEELPAYDGDLERWLRETCVAAHRKNTAAGPGYWELTARPDLPDDLVELERVRRERNRAAMTRIADTLWHTASGRPEESPAALVAAVSTYLSAFFTAAVKNDAGGTWRTAADLAHDAILAAVRQLTGGGDGKLPD